MKNCALHCLDQSHHSPERSLITVNDLPADADCKERIEVDGRNLMHRNVLRRKGSVAVRPRDSLSVGLGEPDPPFVVAAAAAADRRSVSLVVVE